MLIYLIIVDIFLDAIKLSNNVDIYTAPFYSQIKLPTRKIHFIHFFTLLHFFYRSHNAQMCKPCSHALTFAMAILQLLCSQVYLGTPNYGRFLINRNTNRQKRPHFCSKTFFFFSTINDSWMLSLSHSTGSCVAVAVAEENQLT